MDNLVLILSIILLTMHTYTMHVYKTRLLKDRYNNNLGQQIGFILGTILAQLTVYLAAWYTIDYFYE